MPDLFRELAQCAGNHANVSNRRRTSAPTDTNLVRFYLDKIRAEDILPGIDHAGNLPDVLIIL